MTFRAKVLVVLWSLLASVVVVSAVAGWVAGDVAGYLAFGLLMSAAPCDAAIVVAAFEGPAWLSRSRSVWLVVSVAELLFALVAFDAAHPDAYRDMGMVVGFTMGALSFPVGLVSPILLWGAGSVASGIPSLLGVRPPGGAAEFYLAVASTWLSFAALGYLQWFVLVPRMVRRVRARRAPVSASPASSVSPPPSLPS